MRESKKVEKGEREKDRKKGWEKGRGERESER